MAIAIDADHIYVDRGISGGERPARAGFQAMLAAIEADELPGDPVRQGR